MLKEGIDTALACGVAPAKIQGRDLVKYLGYRGPVKKAISYMLIPAAMKKHSHLVSGMYYDLAAGRKCDMDFICGAVAAHAASAGVSVPATRAVLALTERIERGELRVSPDNISVLTQILNDKSAPRSQR